MIEYDLVEFMGETALYADWRIRNEATPNDLYCYDIRGSADCYFSTIEKRVIVNHAGTIIFRKPLDFGEKDFIALDDSLNFTGETMTISEFRKLA